MKSNGSVQEGLVEMFKVQPDRRPYSFSGRLFNNNRRGKSHSGENSKKVKGNMTDDPLPFQPHVITGSCQMEFKEIDVSPEYIHIADPFFYGNAQHNYQHLTNLKNKFKKKKAFLHIDYIETHLDQSKSKEIQKILFKEMW